MSKFPTAADFPIEIQGCKTESLFDTGPQVSFISYDCYKEFTSKTRINANIEANISSVDGSNLGTIGVFIHSFRIGECKFEQSLYYAKIYYTLLLGLDYLFKILE